MLPEFEKRLHRVMIRTFPTPDIKCNYGSECEKAQNCERGNNFFLKCNRYLNFKIKSA